METEAEGDEDADDDPCDIDTVATALLRAQVCVPTRSHVGGGPFQHQVDGGDGGGLADSNGEGHTHATPAATTTNATVHGDEGYYAGGDEMDQAGHRWVEEG